MDPIQLTTREGAIVSLMDGEDPEGGATLHVGYDDADHHVDLDIHLSRVEVARIIAWLSAWYARPRA